MTVSKKPIIQKPNDAIVQRLHAVDLDRLLRQRVTSDPLNRSISDSPRKLFEMDDSYDLHLLDAGQHPVFDYTLGQLRKRGRQYVFSVKGTVTVDNTTPLDLDYDGILQQLRIRLGTAGTSSTIVSLKQNGTTVLTVTLGSGVLVATVVAMTRILVAHTDHLQVFVTTAGSGAADMSGSVTT